MSRNSRYPAYVSVATRQAKAKRAMAKLRKKGYDILPIEIEGRKIAKTFWGSAWCKHLESFSDYANRLPRGRTYVRNGSVCHLKISPGTIEAIVSGSHLYHVDITINKLPPQKWKSIIRACTGQIGSLIELLKGSFSDEVMRVVTDSSNGIFPKPAEIHLSCDCPDWAVMCKHVAATLYGVGARLDHDPSLLFTLRGVDHTDLITDQIAVVEAAVSSGSPRRKMRGNLSEVFGVEVIQSQSKEKVCSMKVANTDNPDDAKEPTPLTAQDIKTLRSSLRMNQTRFGQLMGVTGATISNWERKQGNLKLRMQQLIKWNEISSTHL